MQLQNEQERSSFSHRDSITYYFSSEGIHSIFLVRDAVIYLPRLVPYIFQNFT